jgi:hypothetical protein
MSADRPQPDVSIPLARPAGASFHDRLVDALAQIMLDTDEALAMLSEPEANNLRWIERHLKTVFQEVNAVMFQLTD